MRKLALLLLFTAGCTFHSTDSTEVGVLTRKIALFGKAGRRRAEKKFSWRAIAQGRLWPLARTQ